MPYFIGSSDSDILFFFFNYNKNNFHLSKTEWLQKILSASHDLEQFPSLKLELSMRQPLCLLGDWILMWCDVQWLLCSSDYLGNVINFVGSYWLCKHNLAMCILSCITKWIKLNLFSFRKQLPLAILKSRFCLYTLCWPGQVAMGCLNVAIFVILRWMKATHGRKKELRKISVLFLYICFYLSCHFISCFSTFYNCNIIDDPCIQGCYSISYMDYS